MSLPGCDISAWQVSTPDLARFDFVFVKATEGTTPDARYGIHAGNVRRAGKVLGAYHYAHTASVGGSMAAQASAFLRIAAETDLLAVDVEGKTEPTLIELRDLVRRLKAAGHRVGVYHSLSGFPSAGQDFDWVALWGRQAPSRSWTFWQSSGSGLDLDWFNGDRAALYRLAGLTPPDSSTGEDVDAKAAVPIAVADFGPGSSAYADLASTQLLIGSWGGGTNVGVYATGKRPDGLPMDLVRLDFATGGADLRAVWVGDDKRRGAFRVPGAAPGAPTVTVTSTGPLTLVTGPGVTVK